MKATVNYPSDAVSVRITLRPVRTTDEYYCVVTNKRTGAITNVDGLYLSREEQRTLATDSTDALKAIAGTAVRFAHDEIDVWTDENSRCLVRRDYSCEEVTL